MTFTAKPASNEETLPLRMRYREEMNCQIVHDSIHRRAGWTKSWLLLDGGRVAGLGSIAIAGPWREKPTLLEFYVLPAHRTRAFGLFEALCHSREAVALRDALVENQNVSLSDIRVTLDVTSQDEAAR
jgi:hypothetical protein